MKISIVLNELFKFSSITFQFCCCFYFVFASQLVYASDKTKCVLIDGTSFEFIGHRWLLPEPHEIHSSGKISDSYAYAYSVIYHGKGFKVKLPYNDDAPECVNYGISNGVVFALTDKAIFPYKTPTGKRGGSVLYVSFNNGKTFSGDIHPNTQAVDINNSFVKQSIEAFGYHRSRFKYKEDTLMLEITNPLDYENFLLFITNDKRVSWKSSPTSHVPMVYGKDEVEKWRNDFALWKWSDKVYQANNEACNKKPGLGCAIATDEFWMKEWGKCREKNSGQYCLSHLHPEPKF